MHIIDVVYYWGRTIPLRPAVIEPDGVVTYAGLVHAVEAAAQHFAGNIVDKSKPVAVSLPTGTRMLVGVLGLLRAGFSVVLAYKAVYEHLSTVGCNTLVCARDGAKLERGSNVLFDDGWIVHGTNAALLDKPIPHVRASGGDIICFTSGSTGRPKPVVCPPQSWKERVVFALNSAFSNYERILIFPGLTTSWGLSRAYEALHAGRTVCLAPKEEAMLWVMNTYDVDTVLASPQQALHLAEVQDKVTRYPLSALKTIQIGASVISAAGIRRVQKSLCREVISMYGSTEAGVTAIAPYDMVANVPGAVGFIMPGADAEIVDAADRVLPPESEGFIRVRSSVLRENIVGGTLGLPWFYPGDLGRITENGMLCVAGRITDVLNRGGDKFSISDFESFLMGCPGVKDAGVCTPLGDSGREEAWIALVLDPSTDLRALRHAVETNPTFGKNVDKLFVVDGIPRGELGKIQRDTLKKMLQEIAEGSDNPAPVIMDGSRASD